MADADASAAFELEDDSLSSGLDAIAAKFGAIATQINAGFAGANAQLTRTAASASAIGAATPAVGGFSAGLMNAARVAQLVTLGVSGIAMTVTRLAPLVKFIPDSMGRWVAPVKAAVAEHQKLISTLGVVRGGVQAISGRLTVLNAAFLALNMHGAGAGKMLAVMGAAGALATSKIIAGARGAIGGITALGAAVGRSARGMGGLGGAFGALGRSASTVGMVMSPMLGMALALGPIGAAAMAVAGGFSAIGKSIGKASEIQTLQTGFISLLGSADKARARMAELSKFAASTPFEIPSVVKASKVLETLTGGALSTGAGLRMVGDIASLTGQPFEELAVHVGRLHSGLMNGRPVGEAMQRLQELGVILPATRGKLEDLQKSGAKGGDVWNVALGDLSRFGGEMQRQSATWGGTMSNVKDSIGQVFAAFGAPLITNLTPFMQRMQQWLQSLVAWAARAGQIFAAWSGTLAQIFADGQIGGVLKQVGIIAFKEAVNFLIGGLVGAGNVFAKLIGATIREVIVLLSNPEVWKGIGNSLLAAAQGFMSVMLTGVAKILDELSSIPGIGKAAKKGAALARADAATFGQSASINAAQAAAQLHDPMQASMARFEKTLGEIPAAFAKGKDAVGNVFDASADKDALMKTLQVAWAKAKGDITATAKLAEVGGLPAPVPGTVEASGEGKGSRVGELQKLGLGGGAGPRDPVVAATNSVRTAVEKNTEVNQNVLKALTARRPGTGQLVFA